MFIDQEKHEKENHTMAQVNLTLEQEELLELLAGNREEAFKHLVEKLLNQVLLAESSE